MTHHTIEVYYIQYVFMTSVCAENKYMLNSELHLGLKKEKHVVEIIDTKK